MVGNLAPDISTVALVTATVYSNLPVHCKFVGCEKRLVLFQEVLPSLMSIHERHVISLESDIGGSWEAVDANKSFMEEIVALESMRMAESWTFPAGHVSLQIFPVRKMHCIENIYKKAILFEKGRHIALSIWTGSWHRRFEGKDK